MALCRDRVREPATRNLESRPQAVTIGCPVVSRRRVACAGSARGGVEAGPAARMLGGWLPNLSGIYLMMRTARAGSAFPSARATS